MALPSHMFQDYRWWSTIIVFIYVFCLASIDSVKIIIEKPNEEKGRVWNPYGGMEQFNSLEEKLYSIYETNFTTGLWKGVYYNVSVEGADWYGGAEGTGFYAYTKTDIPYTLEVNKTVQTQNIKLNYFGLWVSALTKENQLDFFYQKTRIFSLSLELIYHKIYKENDYWRNRHFRHPSRTHAFIYLNFYFDDGEYDEIHFSSKVKWFCSDNHSLASFSALPGGWIYEEKIIPVVPKIPVVPSLPADESTLPAVESSLPADDTSPGAEPSLPAVETSPGDEPSRPAVETSPGAEPSRPAVETSPGAESSLPADDTSPGAEETSPEAEPSLPKAETTLSSNTLTKMGLVPIISTAWITIGIILSAAALL